VTKVLPSDHEFVKQTLRDFRVLQNGQRWIARLRGEGRFRSAAFPDLAETRTQVLVELIPEAQWRRPDLLLRWLAALRLPYLTISLLPLLLVLCASLGRLGSVSAPITALLFASVTLIHLACNLWSDYEDHLRGVDNPGQSGGSGVIQKLWIPAVHLRNSAAALFVAGCVLGLVLLSQLPLELVGQRLFWLGLVGVLGAASYSGWPFHYKYFGLGEPIVFVLSGPVIVAGAASLYFPDSRDILRFALLSLPLAFLVVLRLHSGNMQRIPFDSIARTQTIARFCGFAWSKHAYIFLMAAPFLSLGALLFLGLASPVSLVSMLSLGFAWFGLDALRQASGPLDPACYDLRRHAARLHLAFGLLYCLSFLAR
jgi:1,4-dihydroxy-2-naphthoate polyprenyltransferase